MELTRAAYYKQRYGGIWRVARVAHRCDWRVDGLRCTNHIERGADYFDTNCINPNSSSPYAKYRICSECARTVISV